MAGTVLVVVEHDRGMLAPAALEALTAARSLGDRVDALTIGEAADPLADLLAPYGVSTVHQVHDPLLADYGPEAWGEVVAQAVRARSPPPLCWRPAPTVATRCWRRRRRALDLPFSANCTEFGDGEPLALTRVRWGGSLLEDATLTADVKLVTVAHHAVDATAGGRRPARPRRRRST